MRCYIVCSRCVYLVYSSCLFVRSFVVFFFFVHFRQYQPSNSKHVTLQSVNITSIMHTWSKKKRHINKIAFPKHPHNKVIWLSLLIFAVRATLSSPLHSFFLFPRSLYLSLSSCNFERLLLILSQSFHVQQSFVLNLCAIIVKCNEIWKLISNWAVQRCALIKRIYIHRIRSLTTNALNLWMAICASASTITIIFSVGSTLFGSARFGSLFLSLAHSFIRSLAHSKRHFSAAVLAIVPFFFIGLH